MRARLAAKTATGDSADNTIEIFSTICGTCGGIIDPLLGKVHEGTTIVWDVWIKGNYEHRNRPATPHAPIPWVTANADRDSADTELTAVDNETLVRVI